MLELPDIKSSEKKLQEYYTQLSAQHMTPAWIGGGIITEPRSEAVPHLWRWHDLRSGHRVGERHRLLGMMGLVRR